MQYPACLPPWCSFGHTLAVLLPGRVRRGDLPSPHPWDPPQPAACRERGVGHPAQAS